MRNQPMPVDFTSHWMSIRISAWGGLRAVHALVEIGPGTLGFSQRLALRDGFHRKARLLPQPGRQPQPARMTLRLSAQIVVRPAPAPQFSRHNSLGLGLRRFQPRRSRVAFADLAFHSLVAFLTKGLKAD